MARLSQSGARERLARVGSAAQCDPRASFHSLSSGAVAALLSIADDDGYKVPRHADGSRARYFHARLIRAADQKES